VYSRRRHPVESTRSLIVTCKLASIDEEQAACSPKIGGQGKGESACMTPPGITDRQAVSQSLVVVEVDMTVD
jgi:hypothetical protein